MYQDGEIELDIPEVYIPNPWDTPLAEACLETFTRLCSMLAQKRSTQSDGEPRQEIEVEMRIGSIDGDTGAFTPGVPKSLFHGMLEHMKRRVQNPKSKWIRKDGKGPVTLKETDTIDVSFDDGVRASTRVLFANPELTKIKRVEVVEVISKRALGTIKNFTIKNSETRKKQEFDLRLSVACEDELEEESVERSLREDAAKSAIEESYNIPNIVKMLGGCPLVIAKEATNLLLQVPLGEEIQSRGELGGKDPLIAYSRSHNGQVSVRLVGQLQWTLMQPHALPGLRNHEDSNLPTRDLKEDVPAAFVNLPGRIKLGDGGTWVASAAQYVIFCKPKYLRCVTGRYALADRQKTETQNTAAIQHFRRKKRCSFMIGDNLKLDMTRTQQSLNPAGIFEEPFSYEIEVESVLLNNAEQRLDATGLTVELLQHIADLVYGVKLGLPDYQSTEYWIKSVQLDESRKKQIEGHPAVKSSTKTGDDQRKAGDFYNNLDRSTQSSRSDSMIYHMRCFNNFAKSLALQEYIDHALTNAGQLRNKTSIAILDLACGKGADIGKFVRTVEESRRFNASIERYVGSDIARKSLDDAVDRIKTAKRKLPFSIRFIQADLGSTPLSSDSKDSDIDLLDQWDSATSKWTKRPPSQTLDVQEKFDLVSIQFALHYMFQSEERANRFFQTVSQHMYPGGYFVATTVHAGAMIQELMRAGPGESSFSLRDEKNRESCNVTFDSDVRRALLSKRKHKDRENWLGLRYHFLLKDGGADKAAVSAPEWLVPVHELERIARKHNMRLVKYERLPNFVKRHVEHSKETDNRYTQLMERMNVVNCKGTISDVEWKITSLYCVVVLQKVEATEKENFTKIHSELKATIPHFTEIPRNERTEMVNKRLKKK